MRHHTIESDRPKSIRHGDITDWSRATTSFRHPTGKGKGYRTKSAPVTDIDALRRSIVNQPQPTATSTSVFY